MKILYPEIAPYQTFFLETGSKHAVYVEQSGNPDGIPVIFLHGGPCSGTKPDHRRFFNPKLYRIILFDQRGCGLSLPFGELENNTTQDLIDDMERIRNQLVIDQWLVFGGSWGGALALLYAQQHKTKVMGLIIRAVFLARQQDLDWFAKDGAGKIYPEQWQRLIESIPEQSRGSNLVQGLCDVLWGEDELAQRRAAKEWMAWGAQVSLGNDYQPGPRGEHATEEMVKQVRMELHYANHHYFIGDCMDTGSRAMHGAVAEENRILDNCACLDKIPTVIVHGRHDFVCPVEAGYSLHKVLPNAEYVVLPNAGHIAQGKEMINALVAATDRFAGHDDDSQNSL
ncbi:MAG: prolyl aminopeptidase [Methylobacter sp.]|nr:prolyl aminopeptidase [Methylobacter sp.]